LSGAAATPLATGRSTLRLLYLRGAMQDLALVTFPAASAIFADPTGFHLSSAQYGAMFVPQVALAIFASAVGPWLERRLGMRGVLMLSLGADLLAMALLAASALLIGASGAFALLCCATGALGLGFGATVMTLNTLVERLAADRADAAVLTLNALLGVGTALAPALVALFAALGVWWALPLLTAIFAPFCLCRLPRRGQPWDQPPPSSRPPAFRSDFGFMPPRRCSTGLSRRCAAIGRRCISRRSVPYPPQTPPTR